MKPKNQWYVVVGRPKWEAWGKTHNLTPELYHVGTPVIGCVYDTREEARENAKRLSKGNPYWKFHAKKVEKKP